MKEHIKYAIKHEEKCIKLRERQIAAYKLKIDLLKKGKDYIEVLKIIRPVDDYVKFKMKQYNRLKKDASKR